MRNISFTWISLLTLVLAIVAWVCVWFLYTDIAAGSTARARALSSDVLQNIKQQTAVEVTALTSDTSAQRSALDQNVSADVVGIANKIQSAGKAAGTQTIIGSASAASVPNPTSGASLLDFDVQSTGSFAQVWRAAQLFETLPLPSTVQELDFEESPSSEGQGNTWQLTAHIEVLTTSQLGS
jgi:hypothetical protein